MTITLELDQQTAERLKTRAEIHGLSLENYLRRLAQAMAWLKPQRLSQEDFEYLMAEFSANLDRIPPLPPGFCREDIYLDHD